VYEAVYDAGPDPATGKRRQRSQTFATRKEADSFLRVRLGEIERGAYGESGRMTVAELLERWLQAEVRGTVAPSTLALYEYLVRGVLIPGIGGVALRALTPARLQDFYRSALDAGVGETTVMHAHARLSQALKMALRLGLVAALVTARVKVARSQKKRRRPWSRDQLRAFLEAARGSRFYLAYALGLATGLRIGEVLALRWADVDLAAGVLRVEQSYSRVGNRFAMGPPKSESSRRLIRLPPTAVRLLVARREVVEAQQQAAANRWQALDLVLCTEFGRPFNADSVRKEFARIGAGIGVEGSTFHDLRHMHISVLLAGGVPLADVAKQAGHARQSMTADVYSHSLGVERAAGVVEDVLFAEYP
jgi:integrase